MPRSEAAELTSLLTNQPEYGTSVVVTPTPSVPAPTHPFQVHELIASITEFLPLRDLLALGRTSREIYKASIANLEIDLILPQLRRLADNLWKINRDRVMLYTLGQLCLITRGDLQRCVILFSKDELAFTQSISDLSEQTLENFLETPVDPNNPNNKNLDGIIKKLQADSALAPEDARLHMRQENANDCNPCSSSFLKGCCSPLCCVPLFLLLILILAPAACAIQDTKKPLLLCMAEASLVLIGIAIVACLINSGIAARFRNYFYAISASEINTLLQGSEEKNPTRKALTDFFERVQSEQNNKPAEVTAAVSLMTAAVSLSSG